MFELTKDINKIILLSLAIVCVVFPLFSHPLSISKCNLIVKKNKMEAEITIMAEDLIWFHPITSNSNNYFETRALTKTAQLHKDSISNWFYIETGKGKKLTNNVSSIQCVDFPQKGIHRDSLMQYQIRYKLNIPFSESEDLLKVYSEFGGKTALIPAFMKLDIFHSIAKNQNSGVVSNGQPFTFSIGSTSNHKNKKNIAGNMENTKGKSAEVLINNSGVTLRFNFTSSILESLSEAEQSLQNLSKSALKAHLLKFVNENLQITLNGIVTNRHEFSIKKRPESFYSGVIFELKFKTDAKLNSVALNWDGFNWKHQTLEADIEVFGKRESFKFTRYKPVYFWKQ